MKDLKITLVQTPLAWENGEANRKMFDGLLKAIRKNSTNLIILPEMFATGFSMKASKLAESMNGPSVEWMREMAFNKNAVLCGSLIIKEKGKFYNRLVWAQPDGTVLHYDKRHLFRMAKEEKIFTDGKKKLIVNLNGWNVCPLVCYDLRFPVWSRSHGDIDLLLYVANWPERRRYAWKQLLIARAIENQCYVAGLNRIGNDGNNISYSGDSVVLDPFGMPLSNIKKNKSDVVTVTLSYKKLAAFRKVFPVMMDIDKFKLI